MFFGGDPFEHFAGMHGGPGGPGGMRGPPKDVDTTKLYETLGVSVFVRGLGLVAGKKCWSHPSAEFSLRSF